MNYIISQEQIHSDGKTGIPSWLFPPKPIGFVRPTRATRPTAFFEEIINATQKGMAR